MQTYFGLNALPTDLGPSVVTIGKFNGVHIGHQAMIRKARELGQSAGIPSVVVTFDRHPAALFAPENVPADITGLERRIDLCGEVGADALLVLTFDDALAALSPEEFVKQVLVSRLHAREVVVGEDFRFGHAAAGSVDTLTALGRIHGFGVSVVHDVTPDGVRRVSSSWVRQLLEAGDVSTAETLLGRRHAMRGQVVHGDARGRLLGYPTANLSEEATGLMPADGTYAGWLIDQDGTRYPVAISIGTNPTFEGVRKRRLEAHVIGASLDLYDHWVVIEFVKHMRGMYKFDNVDDLIAQMDDDVVQIRAVLGVA